MPLKKWLRKWSKPKAPRGPLTLEQKRRRMYLRIYAMVLIFSVAGLIINAETMTINEKNRKLLEEIRDLKTANSQMRLQLETATRLQQLEEVAVTQLNMKFPEKTIYIDSQNQVYETQ